MIRMNLVLNICLSIVTILASSKLKNKFNSEQNNKIKKYQNKNYFTDSELNLFKETMSLVKMQIVEWEAMSNTSKILQKKQEIKVGIKSAQEIFKELVQHPKESVQQADFLYTKLPGVLSGTDSFISIEKAVNNTEESKQSLDSMLATIIMISESITEDYEKMLANDLDETNDTKQLLSKRYENKAEKFYDFFNELFDKPEVTSKEKNPKIETIKRSLIYGVIGVLILIAVVFSRKYNERTMTTTETSVEMDGQFVDMYPLKINEITKAIESDIDKSKLLELELQDQILKTNRGYQLEVTGELKNMSREKNDWSRIPSLDNRDGNSVLFQIELKNRDEFVGLGAVEVYSNMVNGVYQYKNAFKGEFFKSFPQGKVGDVQKGYILEHSIFNITEEESNQAFTNLFGYYIFKDGTGILTKINLHDNTIFTKITDDLTDEQFKKIFEEEIEWYNQTYKFTGIKE